MKEYFEQTPPHYACLSKNLDIVKYLCEPGANQEATKTLIKTALHLSFMS